eukprot:TRINITY_DN69744_c0_g1_i1.p1 TRINITY_DN69744_c0_g1~~TRINITY_DN69744_c0_g1_i1.p1  ORF type:complete len:627 (+),score=87.38 TRINITY_DN69744_c0_g1_i1:130-2010(+)
MATVKPCSLGKELTQRLADKYTLEWSCQVRHFVMGALYAKVLGNASCRCSIEAWADDMSGEEMAYCRSMTSVVEEGRLRILWLGRRQERPVHPNVQGRRCIKGAGVGDINPPQQQERVDDIKAGEIRDDEDMQPLHAPPLLHPKGRTLAEAIFGVVAAFGALLGATVLELQAMDNGSGKLVAMYRRLGFHITRKEVGEMVWMQAPISWCSRLAPQDWLDTLEVDRFNFEDWARRELVHYRDEQRLHARMRLPWKFDASWPSGGRVTARLALDFEESMRLESYTRFSANAKFVMNETEEVATLQATIRVSIRKMRVSWLGGPLNAPVHQSVRGRRMYSVGAGDDSSDQEYVTVAIALLGTLATIARWVGTEVVSFWPPDGDCDRLIAYLRRYGFERPEVAEEACGRVLEARCEDLTRRCCPSAWREMLPADGEVLSLFATSASGGCQDEQTTRCSLLRSPTDSLKSSAAVTASPAPPEKSFLVADVGSGISAARADATVPLTLAAAWAKPSWAGRQRHTSNLSAASLAPLNGTALQRDRVASLSPSTVCSSRRAGSPAGIAISSFGHSLSRSPSITSATNMRPAQTLLARRSISPTSAAHAERENPLGDVARLFDLLQKRRNEFNVG